MISDQPEPKGPNHPLPQMVPFSFEFDSARKLSDGVRVKAMIVMDITDLGKDGQEKFMQRSLAVLTKMGLKVMEGKDK